MTSASQTGNVKVASMTRVFRWQGLDLPDPNPSADTDEVQDIFSGTYPELATAVVKGPEFEGEKMIYKFEPSAGVKG